MKRVICFVIIIVTALTAFADEKDIEYQRKSLSVQVREGAVGTYTPEINMMHISEYNTWKYYRGFGRITEPEFLLLAGYDFEAQQAQQFRTTNIILDSIGIGLGAVGLGVMFANVNNFESDTGLAIGTLIVSTSMIPLLAVIIRGDNWLPLSKAHQIAQQYNMTLREVLRSE